MDDLPQDLRINITLGVALARYRSYLKHQEYIVLIQFDTVADAQRVNVDTATLCENAHDRLVDGFRELTGSHRVESRRWWKKVGGVVSGLFNEPFLAFQYQRKPRHGRERHKDVSGRHAAVCRRRLV